MVTIPDVRSRLKIIADDLENGVMSRTDAAKAIRAQIPHLYRRPYKRKAPTQSRHVDPSLKAALRRAAYQNPDETYQDIAVRHGVNAGRVSEAVAGIRT